MMGPMKAVLLLSVLLSARAAAAADAAALVRSALPPGFAPVAALAQPVFVPLPIPVPMPFRPTNFGRDASAPYVSIALEPLLDRHFLTTDSFADGAGTTLLGGTLDLNGDGYLAVSPPGPGSGPPGLSTTYFFKIERGMSGQWGDGVRGYRVTLSVNFFRSRLANYIQIRDSSSGRLIWEKRINELFRMTYAAGESVTVAGRAYRLFYSSLPDLSRHPAVPSVARGLCFIYDDTSNGGHYKSYIVPVARIQGEAPTSYEMFGGDVVGLRVTPDLSLLEISAPAR